MRPDLRVCFLGDSLTAGAADDTALGWVGRVVAAARRDGTDLTGYNLGVRRETGPQVAARWLAEARPRLQGADGHGVVLSFGVNDTAVVDGERRVPEAESLASLARIADQAAEQGWPLLVVGPTPVDDDAHDQRVRGLSTAMAGLCAARQLPFVEVADRLAADDEWGRAVAAGDGAHPGERGYARLGDLIRPAFDAWLRTLVRTGTTTAGGAGAAPRPLG